MKSELYWYAVTSSFLQHPKGMCSTSTRWPGQQQCTPTACSLGFIWCAGARSWYQLWGWRHAPCMRPIVYSVQQVCGHP